MQFKANILKRTIKLFFLSKSWWTNKDIFFSGFYSIIANGILALFLAVAIGMIVFQRRRIASLQYDRQMFDHQDQGENKLHNYDNLCGLKEQHKYANLDSRKKELHYQVSSVL